MPWVDIVGYSLSNMAIEPHGLIVSSIHMVIFEHFQQLIRLLAYSPYVYLWLDIGQICQFWMPRVDIMGIAYRIWQLSPMVWFYYPPGSIWQCLISSHSFTDYFHILLLVTFDLRLAKVVINFRCPSQYNGCITNRIWNRAPLFDCIIYVDSYGNVW